MKRVHFLALLLAITIAFAGIIILHKQEVANRFVEFATRSIPLRLQNSDSSNRQSFPLPKESLESAEPLPEKVKESFKSVIGITSQIKLNNQFPSLFSPASADSGGTAWLEESGYFISARHIFMASMMRLRSAGFPFNIDGKGLPNPGNNAAGVPYYTYSFYGSGTEKERPVNFTLELVAMGKMGQFQDFAAFKGIRVPSEIKPLQFEDEVHIGETLYVNGQVPLVIGIEDVNPYLTKQALFDTLRFNFSGPLVAIIPNMPINNLGTKKLYRMFVDSEFGFSGGPVFNKEGKVVGLTILRLNNFVYAVSAEDLRTFIRSVK